MKITQCAMLVYLVAAVSASGFSAPSAGTLQVSAGGSPILSKFYSINFYSNSNCSAGYLGSAERSSAGFTFSPSSSVKISAAGIESLVLTGAISPAAVQSFELYAYDEDGGVLIFQAAPCLNVVCVGGNCLGSNVVSVDLAPWFDGGGKAGFVSCEVAANLLQLSQLFWENLFRDPPKLILFPGDDKGRQAEEELILDYILGMFELGGKLWSSKVRAKEVDIELL